MDTNYCATMHHVSRIILADSRLDALRVVECPRRFLAEPLRDLVYSCGSGDGWGFGEQQRRGDML